MSQPNEPVQNYEVQSPTLETTVRSLLPSVAGYGGLLRATNTIVPVIDLTSSAEGSSVGQNLQTALSFGSQTSFVVTSGTTTIANVAGFYRVFGTANVATASTSQQGKFELTDGSTTKEILRFACGSSTFTYDFIVFLDSGDSLTCSATTDNFTMVGSVRQIATSDGTLVQPAGFVT